MKEDYGHNVIMFRGRLRHVVDIRPLEDYGREMAEPTKCPVCGMANGNHDFQKHQATARTETGSKLRHPAGKRLPPKDSK